METLVEVLRKIAQYSPETKAEFEKLKKQSRNIKSVCHKSQTEWNSIERVMNKLYEENFLGNMDTERYEQLSRKYTEEYYTLKAEEVKIC